MLNCVQLGSARVHSFIYPLVAVYRHGARSLSGAYAT